MGEGHVHHVAVLEIGPDLGRHGEVAEVADDVAEGEIWAAVAGVVARHAGAVGGGVFEGGVEGGVIIWEEEVGADEGGYGGGPGEGG